MEHRPPSGWAGVACVLHIDTRPDALVTKRSTAVTSFGGAFVGLLNLFVAKIR